MAKKPLKQVEIDLLWKLDELHEGIGEEVRGLINRSRVQLNPYDVPQPTVEMAPGVMPRLLEETNED